MFNPGDAQAATGGGGHVVVIGVPGLRWNDLSPATTPTLWRLTGDGAAGAMTVKTVASATCPIDGWLTLSAGQRAQFADSAGCALPSTPQTSGAGATVPDYTAIHRVNVTNKYGAKVGTLGDLVHAAHGCTTAIGPGAALGAADSAGRVDVYAPSVTAAAPADWSKCGLTVVDSDELFRAYLNAGVNLDGQQSAPTSAQYTAALRQVDADVADVVADVPAGTTVLVAGLSDASTTTHLHVALATGPDGSGGGFGRTYLTAASTQTAGLVTLTDVTATALKVLGVHQPVAVIGSPWRNGGTHPGAAPTAEHLNQMDVAAQAYSRLSTPYWIGLAAVQVGLYLFAALALLRRPSRRGRGMLAATRLLALAVAAIPVSTYLANLLPWRASAHPLADLLLSTAGVVAAITAISLGGPWRRSVTRPGAFIAAATALVLTIDVMTGSHLQNDNLLGYTPLVAGRFYGLSNIAWAVWFTSVIFTTGSGVEWLLLRGRRAAAVFLVIAAGVVTLGISYAPMWGAKVGGSLAAVPAFAVFGFMVAKWRVSAARIAAIVVGALAVLMAVAFADSQRANPTHIGLFWNEMTNGDAGTVLWRKIRAMLDTFGNWQLTVIAAAALIFLFLVLRRPRTWRMSALQAAYERVPALRPTLLAALTAAAVGMLVEDSGVAVPAAAFTVAIPLALAASVRAIELDLAAARDTPPPDMPAPRAASTERPGSGSR
jgi:hypothetical protein